ncbi:CPBP family glutamic-type intramembrane protease [Granulicoccus phenolivorans]|uniref:CPBP family glutamic-type intramembrane protease n=1 Tax=Granulicoccus phenolivorans TaxID=266854 RepID=UPI000407841D|nr:CPBP family glutamic-type intramembrane protease [Granulicoccus phenolivorans]
MPASEPPARAPGGPLLSLAWGLLLPLAVLTGYLGLGLAALAVTGEPVRATLLLNGLVLGALGGLRLARPRWCAPRPPPVPAPPVPAPPAPRAAPVAALSGLAVLAGVALAQGVATLAGAAAFDASVRARQQAGPGLTLLLTLGLAPVAEELLFRGLLQPLLRRRLGVPAAVLTGAATFALLHGNPIQAAFALPLGILLGLLYERTGRLILVTGVHAAANAASLLLAGLLAPLAHPVSALLLTAAFGAAAWRFHRTGTSPAAPGQEGGAGGAPRLRPTQRRASGARTAPAPAGPVRRKTRG